MANGVISKHGNHQRSRLFPRAKGARPDKYKFRVDEAAERQAYWDGLSPAEKLTRLDFKLGKGVGATRQREKLNNLLSRRVAAQVVAPTAVVAVAATSAPQAVNFAQLQSPLDSEEKPGKKKLRAKDRRAQKESSFDDDADD